MMSPAFWPFSGLSSSTVRGMRISDENATSEIRMTRSVDEDNPEKGQKAGDIIYDTLYKQYCIVTSVGKKRITNTNFSSGQVSDAMHLVVELEQRTYIEQQLAALGL